MLNYIKIVCSHRLTPDNLSHAGPEWLANTDYDDGGSHVLVFFDDEDPVDTKAALIRASALRRAYQGEPTAWRKFDGMPGHWRWTIDRGDNWCTNSQVVFGTYRD